MGKEKRSKPFGEGTTKVSGSTGPGVAGVSGSGNHESAVRALVTHVEENLGGYLTAEADDKQDYFSLAATIVQQTSWLLNIHVFAFFTLTKCKQDHKVPFSFYYLLLNL